MHLLADNPGCVSPFQLGLCHRLAVLSWWRREGEESCLSGILSGRQDRETTVEVIERRKEERMVSE